MARSKNNSNTNDNIDQEVEAVTDTTEVTEVNEAAEAAEADKPKVDYVDVFHKAIIEFANNVDAEGAIGNVQEVFRAIPVASRGKVQSEALMRAIEDGVDFGTLKPLLAALVNIPASSSGSRSKPKMDDATVNTLKYAGVLVAYEQLSKEIPAEAYTAAQALVQAGIPEDQQAIVTKIAEGIIAATQKGFRGGNSTPRKTFKEKVIDLLNRGDIEAGQVLTGPGEATATVNADGSLTVGDSVFANPTAAAKVFAKKENSSVGGWAFWQVTLADGSKVELGSLRQS